MRAEGGWDRPVWIRSQPKAASPPPGAPLYARKTKEEAPGQRWFWEWHQEIGTLCGSAKGQRFRSLKRSLLGGHCVPEVIITLPSVGMPTPSQLWKPCPPPAALIGTWDGGYKGISSCKMDH